MNFSPKQLQLIAEHEVLLAKNPSAATKLFFASRYLLASEYELVLCMHQQGAWQGALPPPPADFRPGDGSIEFGLFLYWFKNPDLINSIEIRIIAIVLDHVLKLPDSQMTGNNYTYLCTHDLVYIDGTILSTETYATFDQGWFAAFINLLETVIRDTWYNNGNFPMPVLPKPAQLSGAVAGTVNIALIGDWGAGNAAAASVMQQIVSLQPDYIIHLGDVYYGGTPASGDPNSKHYYNLGEEINNFVNVWPTTYGGKSFTLNSNHEMYSGANGLFYDALIPGNSPFSAQKGLSCFMLEFGGWTILGLDSAFNGSSTDAFMNGNLGDATGVQAAWIKGLGLDPAKTIVLTHHTGFAFDGSSVSSLWAQVNAALGGDPYAWYWGHAHNGIVYTNPVCIPISGHSDFTTTTYARCAGHGALPYGKSAALVNNKNVLYQACSPIPSSTQVYNGFVVLTLEATNNQLVTIKEAYYDGSAAAPTWSKTIF